MIEAINHWIYNPVKLVIHYDELEINKEYNLILCNFLNAERKKVNLGCYYLVFDCRSKQDYLELGIIRDRIFKIEIAEKSFILGLDKVLNRYRLVIGEVYDLEVKLIRKSKYKLFMSGDFRKRFS